jgi:uncharacterized damage-inducible protein DinB
MSISTRKIDPAPGFTPEIGRFVAMLEDTRRRTKRYVEGLTAKQLAWYSNDKVESIGTILLHIAAVEHSYIQEDIMRRPMGEEWKIAFPIRFGIPQITGKDLDYFTDQLDSVREDTRFVLNSLTDSDLKRIITPLDPGEPQNAQIQFSIEYILYHLIGHEAHHRGQIAVQKRLLPL